MTFFAQSWPQACTASARGLLVCWFLTSCTAAGGDLAPADDAGGAGETTGEGPPERCLEAIPSPILVPAGPFTMGCDSFGEELPCYNDEQPAHLVTLDTFRIDATEVTVGSYRECVAAGACKEPADVSNADCNYPHPQRVHRPVNCVTWSDAVAFCAFAGGRLPTEAEWEKAARGDDERIFAWGNEPPTCDHANFSGCSPSSMAVGCHPAGLSAYGAHDMAGNVAEYVSDWFDNTWYSRSPADNPVGPKSGEHRGARGGSYYDFNHFQRATFRGGHDPSDTPFDYIGFRCAYE